MLKRILRNILWRRLTAILVALALCLEVKIFAASIASATDFGVMGQTFNIEEESFVVMMKKRLDRVDMEVEKQKIQAKAKEQVENPLPVSGISNATEDKVFYFDPTYTLDKDMVLPCGKIIHKAGTKVNPLEHIDLNRRLFFIDSREEAQIVWLKEQLNNQLLIKEQTEQVEDRIILIGGSVFKLKELLGKEHEDKVYFDQAGELTKKFNITHIPAVLTQEGKYLKIVETSIGR